ncbi:alpha/beta hydrolase family protein [Acidimangrovimonas pyrenivorans]|uniref:Alpha/beta hydrolase family protein n=1 Tax=Acidimangrovimonas pyrenivorans TaxID=2030798 RepID=A0ABV7AHY9_9RHOB
MRFPILPLALCAVLSALAPAGAQAQPAPGVVGWTVTEAKPARTLSLTIWYPAASGGSAVKVGANAVFAGAVGRKDAPVAKGRFPLVLLSHGGLRSAADSGAWLAARLAAAGYVVVAEHGPRLGPKAAAQAVAEIARRSADLTTALDAVQRNSLLRPHLSAGKTAVVGVFLGGTAALSLAGARLDPRAVAASCDSAGTGIDCGWFKARGFDLHQADLAPLSRPAADKRITAAIAIAPEYATGFTPASLAALQVPVEVIDLGRPDTRPEGMSGAALKGTSQRLHYTEVTGASRFDAFSRCTDKGAAILEDSGADAAICAQGGPARVAAHAALALAVLDFLGQKLR